MLPPYDHLLRTFAAVPAGERVLDLGCGAGRHTYPLALLGFDCYACDPEEDLLVEARVRLVEVMGGSGVYERITPAGAAALGYPDAYFDWVIAFRAYDGARSEVELADMLAETRRVMKRGAWVYLAVPALPDGADPAPGPDAPPRFTPGLLRQRMNRSGFAEAEAPHMLVEEGIPFLCGIYRKVDADTPV